VITNLYIANSFHWLVHLDKENDDNIIERKDPNGVNIIKDTEIKDAY